jgi:hypothetical protein
MKSDISIKREATKEEHYRVYELMMLPPRDIIAECSDGTWIKRAWHFLGSFGWYKWEKTDW